MSDETQSEMEMVVAGLVVDPVSNAPIVVLKDPEGDTCLPIWIGMSEATSIATALKNVEVARPMTHDLLKTMMDKLGAKVQRICIVSLSDNTFYASIEIVKGESIEELDARPSDAIALAVRCKVPIFVNKEVLDKAQATIVPVDTQGEDGSSDPQAEELLDMTDVFVADKDEDLLNYAELDKDQLAEVLANMDPDDFKYKM